MQKYLVKVFDMFATFIDVEAESEEDAKTKAEQIINSSESQKQKSFHEITLEPEYWMVMSFEDLEKQQPGFKEKYQNQKESLDNFFK